MKFEIKNLSVGYGENTVLKNINLSLKEGDFLEISGENGSGKSTLLETVSGVKKPLGGEIKTECTISFLPQYTPLIEDLSALDNIKLICGEKFLNDALKLAEKFSVGEFLKKKVIKLSGGTKRKVLLTAVLSTDADIFILDEPFSSLDEESVRVLVSHLEDLKNDGKILILVNHQMEISINTTQKYDIFDMELRATNGKTTA